jgi:nitroimidazol reductase NimA-like FMN-containing flavoprotein (pyridoxamine 5'-phosphate oxidase superfamily)
MQEQVHRDYEIKRFDLPDMSHKEMDELLRNQLLCRVTLNDRPYPYTLPMEYYFFGDTMYFHFTMTGKKMDLMRADPNVCVEVDWSNDDLSDYRSVVMRGRLVEVTDAAERNMMNLAMSTAIKDKVGIKALLRIPFSKKGIDYLSASNIPLTLLKLEVHEMSGKKAH